VASLSVRGSEIVLQLAEFKLTFKPRLSIAGELTDPESIELSPGAAVLRFPQGVGWLRFHEAGPDTLVLEAEVEGYSRSGLLAELRGRLEGYERILAYHFTYDPDGYFGEAPEPYPYPQLKEVEEHLYCPWSYPLHLSSLDGLPENLKVSQLLLRGKGRYAFLLPVPNAGARAYASRFRGGDFSVLLHTHSPAAWRRALLLSISASPNPYRAVEAAYEAALRLLGKEGVLRRAKRLPEVFRYLGWCSWNAFWREPTAEKVLSACRTIIEKGIKLGFVLIDDGWQDEEGGRIRSLIPDLRKFPGGFAPVVTELKRMGVRYVGLWHTLNVHWNGVAAGSPLAGRWTALLMEVDGRLVPNPERAFDMFRDWYAELRRWGFDFVKVDNQSFVAYAYRGRVPTEEAARRLHEGLEAAAHIYSLDVLNCMAQQPENAFNWLRSAVARNCVDYIVPHRKSRDKLHLYFNAYNALWMSQLVWPDWDMFQSHDPWALQQAVARAVSGGPVYITDEPGKTVVEVVRPLAFSDGSLPLPDHPALPTEDVLMRDPYNEPVPLKVFTRVTVPGLGVYGIVAAFNVHKGDEVVEGSVAPSDALLPEGSYVVYEYFSGELAHGRTSFRLEPMGVRLYIIAPRATWLAPLGLKSVYVMPRGIEHAHVFDDEAVLQLREPALLVVWTEHDLEVEGGEVVRRGPVVEIACRREEVRIRRKGRA